MGEIGRGSGVANLLERWLICPQGNTLCRSLSGTWYNNGSYWSISRRLLGSSESAVNVFQHLIIQI